LNVERHGSGAPWEPVVGYSRVVRSGPHIWVAGCTSRGLTPGDQMRGALGVLVDALATVGATPADVVRTRMYVTDATRWEEVGRAHGEVFADVRPVSTLVEVKGLLEPWMQVEVEADAFVAGT
jgi:enamine deaminase RidA (YjgF/YER057c/UK114 family)